MGTILDYSVEESGHGDSGFDKVSDQIIKTVSIAALNPSYSFSCIKVTGVTRPQLLEKMSQVLEQSTEFNLESLVDPIQFYKSTNQLSEEELKDLQSLVHRLDRIFVECKKSSVPILVDAEQTYYQPAIHHLVMSFSYHYNKDRPLIYNTYQMYLCNGVSVLNSHLEQSKKQGFHLGAKIVRGAYLVSERERAKKLNYSDPILPTIEDTHASYNKAIHILAKEVNNNNVGVMIASHNEDSAYLGLQAIKDLGIDPNNPNIQFGQLFGMADPLSFNLVNHNQRVFKYVPYGPVKDVLPYIIRRMHENRGFVGSNSAKEISFLKKELKRRLFSQQQ
eukprot:gene8515-10468_t